MWLILCVSVNNTSRITAGKPLSATDSNIIWMGVKMKMRERGRSHHNRNQETGRRTYTSWCLRQTPLTLTNCQSQGIIVRTGLLRSAACVFVFMSGKYAVKDREDGEERRLKATNWGGTGGPRETWGERRDNRGRKKQKQTGGDGQDFMLKFRWWRHDESLLAVNPINLPTHRRRAMWVTQSVSVCDN